MEKKQEIMLASVLRAYIGRDGVTGRVVADEVGINTSSLSRIVNGDFLPSADTVIKLIDWLFSHIDVVETVTLEETKTPTHIPVTVVESKQPKQRKPVGKKATLTPAMRRIVNSAERAA